MAVGTDSLTCGFNWQCTADAIGYAVMITARRDSIPSPQSLPQSFSINRLSFVCFPFFFKTSLEPLGLQAVLDSASGVMSISERLLKRLRRHFGGVDVSPLKSGPCQVSVADGRAYCRHSKYTAFIHSTAAPFLYMCDDNQRVEWTRAVQWIRDG